jgi:hypothetical protein
MRGQGLQKNVLKRQGRLVSFDCALLVITNKCNHVAWISDIYSCLILETVKLLAGKD